MRCDEFLDRLNDALDKPSDSGALEAVRRHAAACADCQMLLEQWQQVDALLRSGQYRHPPLHAAAVSPPGHRPPNATPRRRSRAPLLATAAVLLIAVAAVRPWRNEPPLADAEPVLSSAAQAAAEAAPVEESGMLGQIDAARVRAWARQAWEPVDPLAEGVRPIAGSFRTALEAFSDALPLSGPHPVG